MNLWVNRLRQLATLAVALFFFSCEDENSFLGFRNPNTKFENYTIEIPLESRVLMMDSLRTSNFYINTDANRLLVGKYADPVFGTITANAISQYYWTSAGKLPEGAILDSVRLLLSFDTYFYGSETPATQTFTVHEVLDNLIGVRRSKLVNKYEVGVSPAIASTSMLINPPLIRERINPPPGETAQPDTLKFILGEDFYLPLWNAARSWSYNNDSTLSAFKPEGFLTTFRGLAIQPDPGNSMIIGFNTGGFTQLVFHYHTATRNYQKLIFTFNNDLYLQSFNQILSDLSGTPLNGIEANKDFLPGTDFRYMQAGTGIVTKILFDNFLAFADTVGQNIIINEARLVIENVEDNTADISLRPPTSLVVRNLTEENKVRRLANYRVPGSLDSLDLTLFKGTVRPDVQELEGDLGALVLNDGGTMNFQYNAERKMYNGTATLFLQSLYRNKDRPVWKDFILFPMVTSPGAQRTGTFKSVNRVVFPADKIVLKLKYTKPTVLE